MAAVNTELKKVYCNDTITKIYGTFATSGGTTTGVIIPGYNANGSDVVLSDTRGIRRSYICLPVNNANSNAFKCVKSFDATAGSDKFTITCTANDTFDYVLEGFDEGLVGS